MNNIWSSHIQGINTLYFSRKLRFNDRFFNEYKDLFAIDREKEIKILEIGCGPGALCGALHRWYPKAKITGIDRDSQFIEFAKQNEKEIEFLEADATNLPFDDASFDVVISNTVSEHVEPSVFYGEQKRVLKAGGICLVLSSRKGFVHKAQCLELTEDEKLYWESLSETENVLEKYEIGKYNMNEKELPSCMEKNEFSNISVGFAVINLTPDNFQNDLDFAKEIILSEKYSDLDAVKRNKSPLQEKAVSAINQKYEKRIELLNMKQHQWDTYTSIIMVTRGLS